MGREAKSRTRYGSKRQRHSAISAPRVHRLAADDPLLEESINRLGRNRPRDSAQACPVRLGTVITVAVGIMLVFLQNLGAYSISVAAGVLLTLIWSGQSGLRLIGAFVHLPLAKIDRACFISKNWPVYSVLVPLFQEADVVSQLIRALRALDYPRGALDVLLLVEADDPVTLEALNACDLDSRFRIIVCPKLGPQTKPKALQIGLQLARGAFVTVFDAEDRPHPLQLKEAATIFNRSSRHLACLQAPLEAIVTQKSIVGTAFAAEYRLLFMRVLPALARLGIPFPIGGTSNHFRVGVLREIGGWDPFNVTEDADVAYRLARNGFTIGMLSLPTLESTPSNARTYLKQRSRWLKGFFITFLVVSQSFPGKFHFISFFSAFIFLIGSFSSAALFVRGLVLVFISQAFGNDSIFFPAIMLLWVASSILCGFRAGCRLSEIFSLFLACFLQQLAALRAIIELVKRPYYWDKTPHEPWRRVGSIAKPDRGRQKTLIATRRAGSIACH